MNGPALWIFTSAYLIAAGLMAHLVMMIRRARDPRPRTPATRRAATARGNVLLEAAFLAGGPHRVAHTTLLAMQRDGRLHISRDGTVSRAPGAPHNAVEGQIVGALGHGNTVTTQSLCRRVIRSRAVRDIGTALVEAGLLVEPTARTRITRRRRLVCALLPILVVAGVRPLGNHTATALTTTGLLILMTSAVIVLLARTSKRRLWCTSTGRGGAAGCGAAVRPGAGGGGGGARQVRHGWPRRSRSHLRRLRRRRRLWRRLNDRRHRGWASASAGGRRSI